MAVCSSNAAACSKRSETGVKSRFRASASQRELMGLCADIGTGVGRMSSACLAQVDRDELEASIAVRCKQDSFRALGGE